MNMAAFLVPLIPIIWVFPVIILLVYLTLASDLMRRRHGRWQLERVDAIVFIFLLLCSLSFLQADLTFRSPQNYLRHFFSTYLFPVLAYFAFRLIRFSDGKACSLRKSALTCGVIFSFACLFEFLFSHPLYPEFDNPDQWVDGMIFRAGTLAGGSVHAGETMAAFIALTLPFIFFRYPGKSTFRLLLLLAIEVMGLGIILARAGYIAALTCVFLASLLLRGRRQLRSLVVAAGFLLFLMAAPSLPIPDWFPERMTSESSSVARIPRFWAGINFIQENFVLGWQTALLGRGFIASYVGGGHYLESGNPATGAYGSLLEGGFHNGYLTLLADQGLLAFGCYIFVLIEALRRLWRYCRQFRLLARPILKNPALLEPVGWGLVLITHLIVETVHWSVGFPQMFYFFMALAMVFNLTSPKRLVHPVRVVNYHGPAPTPGSIRVNGGFKGGGPAAVMRRGARVGAPANRISSS